MLNQILRKDELSKDDLLYLIGLESESDLELLFKAAYEVKTRWVGRKAYYRGLIEMSNLCLKNCFYCGIRSGNHQVKRFTMSREEVLGLVAWAERNQYGSVTLQSGERNDLDFIELIDDLLSEIGQIEGGRLGVTLCLGEQRPETYKRWRELGAHRYLLRMETSSPELYRRIHPADRHHDFDYRRQCLSVLKGLGYQVGTGVMIGLPGQTLENLVDDIIFYRQMDIDMIGMGPYVVHQDTPLGRQAVADGLDSPDQRRRRLDLSLKMIALTRLYLKNVNIAATTALQALDHLGREKGLLAGANILMPIITSREYRRQYMLYDDKPCLDDNADQCRHCLSGRVQAIGEEVGFGLRGDSPHYSPAA
ncbi:MAG: [FeFe] hydrogenase H-cluster radical SAM maturase HydE [Candidatus Adiutrix sp.]|jgi:biotin synthase|nr:[FeFe] hydrogenase H-cluster radical SAM maturase HydE [Candidatus Adiutrix sp.]